jgi:hypothetical protein
MPKKTTTVEKGSIFINSLNGDIYYIFHFGFGFFSEEGVFLARRLIFDEKSKTTTFNNQISFISELNFKPQKGKKNLFKKVSQKEYNSWPSWKKHFHEVPEALASLSELAHSFSRLDYKNLSDFLFLLSVCVSREAKQDKRRRKRFELAHDLENASSYLSIAGQYFSLASMICEKKKDLP